MTTWQERFDDMPIHFLTGAEKRRVELFIEDERKAVAREITDRMSRQLGFDGTKKEVALMAGELIRISIDYALNSSEASQGM